MIFNVGAGGASNAESIKYDNSLSGLEADNVQGAINEVSDSLTADNAQAFQFAYDSATQKYGYKVKEADTEVFVPFSEEIVEETVTQTVTHNGTNEVKVTFTFNNLKEVIGVKAFSCNKSGTYFYIVPASTRPFVISGNTVTVYVVLYNGSASYSITAIGYAN